MRIPDGLFVRFDPPPYVTFGAPYGDASPWMLRQGVLQALGRAQNRLQIVRAGWKIMLFDLYRPNSVQMFMVTREFRIKAQAAGYDPNALIQAQREELAEKVFRYWAMPSDDPATPPPHSTGAALDITLADEQGREVDMGSPIDEGAEPAAPDYFASATDSVGKNAHRNRCLLRDVMRAEGFHQHPHEWWHFSRGDQLWAWSERQRDPSAAPVAMYGRADLLV